MQQHDFLLLGNTALRIISTMAIVGESRVISTLPEDLGRIEHPKIILEDIQCSMLSFDLVIKIKLCCVLIFCSLSCDLVTDN